MPPFWLGPNSTPAVIFNIQNVKTQMHDGKNGPRIYTNEELRRSLGKNLRIFRTSSFVTPCSHQSLKMKLARCSPVTQSNILHMGVRDGDENKAKSLHFFSHRKSAMKTILVEFRNHEFERVPNTSIAERWLRGAFIDSSALQEFGREHTGGFPR